MRPRRGADPFEREVSELAIAALSKPRSSSSRAVWLRGKFLEQLADADDMRGA